MLLLVIDRSKATQARVKVVQLVLPASMDVSPMSVGPDVAVKLAGRDVSRFVTHTLVLPTWYVLYVLVVPARKPPWPSKTPDS